MVVKKINYSIINAKMDRADVFNREDSGFSGLDFALTQFGFTRDSINDIEIRSGILIYQEDTLSTTVKFKDIDTYKLIEALILARESYGYEFIYNGMQINSWICLCIEKLKLEDL